MTAINSSILIGSASIPLSTITVNGTDVDVAAGTYYLYDNTDAISLIDQVEDAISTVVANTTVRVCLDRKIRIVSGGAALTLTIPDTLMDLLGMPANPTVGTTINATTISNLLWSPSWPETSTGHPQGISGSRVYDRVVTSSSTGATVYTTVHSYQTLTRLSWQVVPQERAWTAQELGGEYVTFWREIIVPGQRWKLYSGQTQVEDAASTSPITWTTPTGPYKTHDVEYDWYVRFLEQSDSIGANISLNGILTGEIS